MGRRHSRTAVLERDFSEAGSRAAETISELADRALAVAREAGHAATPAVQASAQGLSRALEKAAVALSDTGEHLVRSGEPRVAEATNTARVRLADASEKFAESIRPKKKHHRVRNILIAAAVVGGVVALVQSPLRGKIQERLFGPSPDDEPETIQLPGSDSIPSQESASTSGGIEPGAASSDAAIEGNGVASSTPSSRETSKG
jgi:hypothetical protein